MDHISTPAGGQVPDGVSALSKTQRQLNETTTKIYDIYSKSIINLISPTRSDQPVKVQVREWNISYQRDTPKMVKWIAQWLAKIGYNTRYSLQEELIQLDRIMRAIPILEKEKDTNSLAQSTLEILQGEEGVAKLTLPQKMFIATAAKDWTYLCELGEEACCFDPTSMKNSLFPPKYTANQLKTAWENAIYKCISDKQSDFKIFCKLTDLGFKNRFWKIDPLYSFNQAIITEIHKDFPFISLVNNQPSPIQMAVCYNRADFVKYLLDFIDSNSPFFTFYEPDKLLNAALDNPTDLQRVNFFDTTRLLQPQKATELVSQVCKIVGTKGFLLQKALLQQQSLTKEERTRLEQLVSFWIPERDLPHRDSPRDFTIIFQGKSYPCNKKILQTKSKWAQILFNDHEIGDNIIISETISAGPHIQRLLDHIEGVEPIPQEDLMYQYFDLTDFEPKYVQIFTPFDKDTNSPK